MLTTGSVVTDLPETVEVTVAAPKKGRQAIHLVNCSFDKTRPIKEIVPAEGRYLALETRAPFRNATDLATGRRLRMRRERGYVKRALPALNAYHVVVLQ